MGSYRVVEVENQRTMGLLIVEIETPGSTLTMPESCINQQKVQRQRTIQALPESEVSSPS